MGKLERERGHFYNWYDTQSLRPLNPVYISTVDSGNLCGHLLTLRIALRALCAEPIIGARTLHGIDDTLRPSASKAQSTKDRRIDAFRQRLRDALSSRRAGDLPRHAHGDHANSARSAVADRHDSRHERCRREVWARALLDQCLDAKSRTAIPVAVSRKRGARRSARSATRLETAGTISELARVHAGLITHRDAADGTIACSPTSIRPLPGAALKSTRSPDAGEFAQMDFGMLYDKDRHLLTDRLLRRRPLHRSRGSTICSPPKRG